MRREAKIAGAGPLADYKVGDRVMTVEGYPGTVSDVHEGPADLTTIFVTLDGGMGGGEYAEAELAPLSAPSTAALQAAIVEAGVEHTAADDYPELGTILSDRLPPPLQSRIAGAAWTHADDDEWDDDLATARWARCSGCGEAYPKANPAGALHDHWTADEPHTAAVTAAVPFVCSACGDTYFSDSLEDEPHGCGKQALYLPPVPKSEQQSSSTNLDPTEKAGFDEGMEQGKQGLTREPSQPENIEFMAGFDLGWAEGVTVAREPANSWDIEDLGKDQVADLPSSVPTAFGPMMGSLVEAGGTVRDWVKENGQPGSTFSYDWCRFRRNSHCHLPKGLDEPATRLAGYAVWIPEDRGNCWRTSWESQQKCPTGMPGPKAGGFTDATVSWDEGGQRNGTPGSESPDPKRYGPGSVPGGVASLRTSALSFTGAFEFTASWKDVREKAKRIRTGGHVRVVAVHDNVIVGHVKGDHGIYETEVISYPGKRNAAAWHCGCKWASYSWGRSGPWKRFEGRMCSHALALQYEAQSRGSMGRTITLDEAQPAWMQGAEPKAASLRVIASPVDDRLRQQVQSATTLEAAAKAMLTLARREEPKVVDDIKTLCAGNHGEMVGLDFRFKSEGSLLRKMKAEAVLFRNPGEVAMNMSDTLRFTVLFPPEDYTQDTEDVLNGLRARGYKTRTKNYWGRGDAYNGVNVALTTPNGHPVELQFHTEESFEAKEKQVHPVYEKWRVETDPNRKAIMGGQMRDMFDMVHRPDNALRISDLKRQPMTPWNQIQWYPGKAASSSLEPGDGYRYLVLHRIDGDDSTPDPVYAVLRVTDGTSEVWNGYGWEDDPEYGRYAFLGEPNSEEVGSDEAYATIAGLSSLATLRSAGHHPVYDIADDEPAPTTVLASQMLAEGQKYASVREMLLEAGVEAPAKVVSSLRVKAFMARVDGEFVDVQVDAAGLHYPSGDPIAADAIEFPQWHPTLGLNPDDEKVAVPSLAFPVMAATEKSAAMQASQSLVSSKDENVSPSEHGDPRMQDKGVSVKKTKDGKYYVCTHRARGKYRDSVADIPDSEIEEIRATGSVVPPFVHEASAEDLWVTASPKVSSIKEFLDAHKTLREMTGQTKPEGHAYVSIDDLIVQNGRPFPKIAKTLPEGMVRGAMGDCYANAANAVIQNPSLTYVEGYALSAYMPLPHAWVVDRSGTVYDLTWEKGYEYFGVPVETGFLGSAVVRSGYYGLFGTDVPSKDLMKWLKEGFPANAIQRVGSLSAEASLFDGYSDEDVKHHLAEFPNDQPYVFESNQGSTQGFMALWHGMPVGQITYTVEQDESAFDDDDDVAAKAKGDHNGYYAVIDALAVTREARRRGVGTALLKAFIEMANKRYGYGTDPKDRVGWDPGSFTKDGAALWQAVMHESVPVTQRITYSSLTAARGEGWLINGKPYEDGVWIEVEPDVWYRGADRGEIPSSFVVRRDGDQWKWEAQVLTFIGAPHEKVNPKGQAKTLEQAQTKALASIAKDQEHYDRYDQRMRSKSTLTVTADEDQCPYDASDSLDYMGKYICEDGHIWSPSDPAALAYHGDGPERGQIQPMKEGS